jgi:hypothetical protein
MGDKEMWHLFLNLQYINSVMLTKLKYKYGNYILNKNIKHRKHTAISINFNDIRNMGIVFEAESMQQTKEVSNILDSLPEKIQCNCIGFTNNKQLSEIHKKTTQISYFCKADINWYFKPVSDGLEQFISMPFDVLIDLSNGNVLPLKFIIAKSHARLLAGQHREDAIYDFMIKQKGDFNPSKLFNQIQRYLLMTNPR